MTASSWSIVLVAVLGAGPIDTPPVATLTTPIGLSAEVPCASPVCNASGECRYPFDAQDAWLHGYHQEIAPYGGFNAFRPYNYKHVLTQSQIASQWGMPATAPYSQQFWQRYQTQASPPEGIVQSNPDTTPVQPAIRPAASSRVTPAGYSSAPPSRGVNVATDPKVMNAVFSAQIEEWPGNAISAGQQLPVERTAERSTRPNETVASKAIANGGATVVLPSNERP
jgi:hypothetical protein